MCGATAHAEIANDKVKIGVLTDLSGIYEAGTGNGSVEAVKMAAEEFGGKINGKPIEILAGDHQNKPDLGASIANRWYDVDKVDAIADLVNSAVAFAVLDIAKQKNKAILLAGAGSADFTGKACAPDNSVHWVYDSYELGTAIGAAVPQLGKKWFLFNADYAFGAAMEQGVRRALEAQGATVVGQCEAPARHHRLFVLRAAGQGRQSGCDRAQQRRRRHQQRHQGGARVRAATPSWSGSASICRPASRPWVSIPRRASGT